MSDEQESAESLIDRIHLPHKTVHDWVWSPHEKSLQRLVHYVGILRDAKIGDAEISRLISDIAWDSYKECVYSDVFTKSPESRE